MRITPFAASLPNKELVRSDKLVSEVKYKYRRWDEDGQFDHLDTRGFYILKLTDPDGKEGFGLLGLISASAYGKGKILPHEATIEASQKQQIRALCEQQAMTKPVLLTYRQSDIMDWALQRALLISKKIVDVDYLNYRYEYYFLSDARGAEELSDIWAKSNLQLLVADGHHRLASSVVLQDMPGTGAPSRLSALLLADEWLKLDAFYRIIDVKPGQQKTALLEQLHAYFEIKDVGSVASDSIENEKATVGEGHWLLYFDGNLFDLRRRSGVCDQSIDPIWFNDCILPDVFDIHDSRSDPRIQSKAMGPHGKTLAEWAIKYPDSAIFAGHPINGETFFALIEERKLLPPKSTCFYPRIPSGLVVFDWLKY
ncbi:MAG: DUF1015 family protein [Bacteroidota bacterium]